MNDALRTLDLPELSLVVLVGATGSGKSHFAAKHFQPTQILSSDYCRALVSDDENDQQATSDAFDVLNFIAGKRLTARRIVVVDATNVKKHARESLLRLAREHDVLPVAIVLDVPESTCLRRNKDRTDRDLRADVVRRQRSDLRRSLKSLQREGFRRVHVLRDESEVDTARIRFDKLFNDKRDELGPFDVIGDVHGCLSELEDLLTKLGYRIVRDERGRAVDATPPEGRKAIFLGDLVDRGPDTPGVLRLAMGMVSSEHALAVAGNHEDKLVRALRGRKVRISHGLAESLAQLSHEDERFQQEVLSFCDGLVAHYVLDQGRLVVAHAGLPERYQGRASGRVRGFALYGDTTGETDEFGLPVRYPWANDYRGNAMVLYGHTPVPEVEWINKTLCLDTGCVFGGELTALRYPEKDIVSVPAQQVWSEPVRPVSNSPSLESPEQGQTRSGEFGGKNRRTPRTDSHADEANNANPPKHARDPNVLDLADVTGKRVVETQYHGRISIHPEQSAAALEIMSRFALNPRQLPYLPPTMSPCSTAKEGDLLEHPERAFADYRKSGVRELICEKKHMGSRAVVLLRRDIASSSTTADNRFGLPDGSLGAIYTRTGQSFFDSALTHRLLSEIHSAVSKLELWDTVDSNWLLFDTEVLPWSAKARELIRTQYAGTAAAAASALNSATSVLRQAEQRGLDVGELARRVESRNARIQRFRDAYQHYCWPTEGLEGLRVAPFQLLASKGQVFTETAHEWHLNLADSLAELAPHVFAKTDRRFVDTANAESVAEASRWWEDLTASGTEGMVVKPAANLVRGDNGLVQPGIKVRGRDYLRLVYGPDYTEPHNLERLRQRQLGPKRSLARREYALGLEALQRVANGEPLWLVHECVFAVLALESEPVDPRL